MDKYEACKLETIKHQQKVDLILRRVALQLIERAVKHDASKLEEPELSIFTEYTPKLRGTIYGSDQYKQYLGEMNKALVHHYENNRHHPEHFEDGIRGMNLVDLVEMFCDWKAATMRHADGDIMKSIDINQKRFNYSDDLAQIFRNTALLLTQLSE